MAKDVFILGGAQTDFARNLEREGGGLFELFRDVAEAAFVADVRPRRPGVGSPQPRRAVDRRVP